MPQGAEGTPFTYAERGYTFTNGYNLQKDWNVNAYRRYAFEKDISDTTTTDNCAMLCDYDPECKSFSIFNDRNSNKAQCLMSKNKSYGASSTNDNRDNSGNYIDPADYQNVKNYDRPNTAPVLPRTNIEHTLYGTPDSVYVDYTAFKACHGKNCCDNYRYPWTNANTTRGYYSNDRDDHCRSTGAAASACLPGKVTYVNEGGNNNSVICHYNRLDTNWTQQNWENLTGFGFDTNNIQAIKLAHCNGLTYDQLTRDINQCTSVSGFNKNIKLLELISNTWWTDPNEVSKLKTMAENSKTDSSLIDGVKTKLRLLPTSSVSVWSTNVVKFIRSLVKDATSYAQEATQLSMDYCTSHPGEAACSCINDFTRWNENQCINKNCGRTSNQIAAAISETTNTVIKGKLAEAHLPLCHSSECQDESILIPGRPTSTCPAGVVNICQDQTVVGGSIQSSSLRQICNMGDASIGSAQSSVTTSAGTTSTDKTSTGKDDTGGDNTDGDNKKYYILGAILCVLCLVICGIIAALSFSA